MKVGNRGQVTITKHIRDGFGIGPNTEVEFQVTNGSIVLAKATRKLDLSKWKGHCGRAFAELGFQSVDDFIDSVRGR